jgi:hypothetical protein
MSCRSAAPSLLLKGLSVVLPEHLLQQQRQSGSCASHVDAALLGELRAAALAALAGRPLPQAQQDLPLDLGSAAPLYWPTEKVRCSRQAWGRSQEVAAFVPVPHASLWVHGGRMPMAKLGALSYKRSRLF